MKYEVDIPEGVICNPLCDGEELPTCPLLFYSEEFPDATCVLDQDAGHLKKSLYTYTNTRMYHYYKNDKCLAKGDNLNEQ